MQRILLSLTASSLALMTSCKPLPAPTGRVNTAGATIGSRAASAVPTEENVKIGQPNADAPAGAPTTSPSKKTDAESNNGTAATSGATDDKASKEKLDQTSPQVATSEELKALCDTPELVKQYELDDRFPEPPTSCMWGLDASSTQNGNIGKMDQRISARYEEWRALKLPRNAMLCEMVITFKDANGSPEQVMGYDDEIFILFDDFVIASSKDYNSRLGRRATLPIYNWFNLAGTNYQSEAQLPPYCIDGPGTCTIPKTQSRGILSLTLSPGTTRKLAMESGIRFESKMSFTNYPQGEHAIGMVTIGDNDEPADCKHSPLLFQVRAKYVVP